MQPEDYWSSLINSVKLQDTKLRLKLVVFLYTNNERTERKIKETISFTIASKRIKNLGINLPKEMKDQYHKNYKILIKKIQDNTNGNINHVLELK